MKAAEVVDVVFFRTIRRHPLYLFISLPYKTLRMITATISRMIIRESTDVSMIQIRFIQFFFSLKYDSLNMIHFCCSYT